MSALTQPELAYLTAQRRLGRLATVGRDGGRTWSRLAGSSTPSTTPSTWRAVNLIRPVRDVARSGRAAIVIDDLASTDPWRPRAIEVHGRADAVTEPEAIIRIHPERVLSWGLDDGDPSDGASMARDRVAGG